MTHQDNPEIGRTVDAAGLDTNYQDVGDGRVVVLLHGSGPGVTGWANWRLTIPALAERRRVLAPDITGFGYTDKTPDDRYDMQVWLRHLLGFLDALGIRSSVVLPFDLPVGARNAERIIEAQQRVNEAFREAKERGDNSHYGIFKMVRL